MITSWKNGLLPKNNLVFAIGDIHGEFILLKKLLYNIELRIQGFSGIINIIFVGDYIDRGLNSKKTIDILIKFQDKYLKKNNVNICFLCGNHDDFFIKFLLCKSFILGPNKSSLENKENNFQLLMTESNEIYISGLKIWLDIGGGKTTIMNYSRSLYKKLEVLIDSDSFNQESLFSLNVTVDEIKNCIPNNHRQFFLNLRNNSHFIIGDFLFTHAGIDPTKSLEEQGVGCPAKTLSQKEFLKLIMLRDKFLWRDNLPNCPYYVVHGHTPSEKKIDNVFIADGQKNYRLCIDSKVYDKDGSLTYFYKDSKKYEIVSFPKKGKHEFLSYQ